LTPSPTPTRNFRNRIVLIGVTAAGLGDMHTTPVSAGADGMPGVVINAYLLRGLQDGSLIPPQPDPASPVQPAAGAAGLLLPPGRRAMPCCLRGSKHAPGIAACCWPGYWFAPVSSMLVLLVCGLPASSSDRPACKHWPPPMV
jgi:CHASE2 domain-containing sensor protein